MPGMVQMPKQAARRTDKMPEIVTRWDAVPGAGFASTAILLEAN
jgi:hypothetical protein